MSSRSARFVRVPDGSFAQPLRSLGCLWYGWFLSAQALVERIPQFPLEEFTHVFGPGHRFPEQGS